MVVNLTKSVFVYNIYFVILFVNSRAYDKAAIKCNGREAVTNFEPSSYQGEIVLDANREGIVNDFSMVLGFFFFSFLFVLLLQEENLSIIN